jgi:hypothetical protein
LDTLKMLKKLRESRMGSVLGGTVFAAIWLFKFSITALYFLGKWAVMVVYKSLVDYKRTLKIVVGVPLAFASIILRFTFNSMFDRKANKPRNIYNSSKIEVSKVFK